MVLPGVDFQTGSDKIKPIFQIKWYRRSKKAINDPNGHFGTTSGLSDLDRK